MAADEHKASEAPFRRQVTFRIGPEDAPLLELAARVHGGLQAGILAALRVHATDRLREAEPDEAPAETPDEAAANPEKSAPVPKSILISPDRPENDHVELNVSEAAAALGVSAPSLREKIKRGTAPGRVGTNGLYVAAVPREKLKQSGIELSLRGAADVLGLKPSTIRSRCKARHYPNARNDGRGWTIPVTDIL